jgi:hypothetical protein
MIAPSVHCVPGQRYPQQTGSPSRKVVPPHPVASHPNKFNAQNKQLTPNFYCHFPKIQLAAAYPEPTGTNDHRNEQRNQ